MLEITVLYVTGWNQRPTPGKPNTLVRFQRDINYTRGIFAQTIRWSVSRPVSSSAGIGSSLRLSVGGWLVERTSMCDDVEPEIDFLLLPCDWESSMTCDDMIRWAKQLNLDNFQVFSDKVSTHYFDNLDDCSRVKTSWITRGILMNGLIEALFFLFFYLEPNRRNYHLRILESRQFREFYYCITVSGGRGHPVTLIISTENI